MTLTADEVALYRTDLLSYAQYMFKARKGAELKFNDHQVEICNALERVVLGMTKRLIINVPPRSGKTELAVINWMAWCMGNWPDSEFIHASYAKRLATTNTWATRSLVEHEAHAAVFGKADLRGDSNAKDEWRTASGGIVYATGADGTITGYGAGKMRDRFGGAIVIDDPHKASEGTSDTMRKNVIDWFSTTMESRKNSNDTPIVVIMQRLHEDDLSGWLLSGGNGEEWESLCIPAIKDDGQSFWPEQFELENLRRMEKANSYVFAGQYMQRPAPVGGGLLKDAWWKYYDRAPEFTHRLMFADTAQKTADHNDFSVFQLWGYTADGCAYFLDQVRGKWEAPELQVQALAFWNKHNHRGADGSVLRAFRVEDKSSGTGLIQTLKAPPYRVPIFPIQREKDKVTRAYDAAPVIESGRVFLPSNAPWLSEFLAETTAFPNGKHDDQVDPMLDAVDELIPDNAPVSKHFRRQR